MDSMVIAGLSTKGADSVTDLLRSTTNMDNSNECLEEQLEDDLVKEALISNIDLREYSKTIENELKSVEKDAVKHYIRQADDLALLHNEITACDSVLQNMEKLLDGFQTALGTISADIQSLQDESLTINQRLKNRQAVRGELSQLVDDIAVPKVMIRSIFDRQVTEREFLEQLYELQHKLQFIKAQEFKDAKAAFDVHDVIENLKFKAIEKIREWLLLKIYQFRKPQTNYQITQSAMLKNRLFYEFLLANDKQIAKEIHDEYVDTMSKTLFSYFKTYASRLFKLQHEDTATKEDVIGAEDTSRVTGFFSSKPQVRNRATVFSLGQRINVLVLDLESPLIVPHVAQQNNEHFHFEALFRSIQYALVDHASHEYTFGADFFAASRGQAVAEHFSQKATEDKVIANFDAISLLLCIQMCNKYQQLMLKRQVPTMEIYWNNMKALLWDRFELIMNVHIDSLASIDIKRLGSIDTRPHYIVRRYAEFTSALLVSSQQSGLPIDDRLQVLLTQLQAQVEQLLARLSHHFKPPKEQLICSINNYDIILCILAERLTEETRETVSFKELQQMHIGRYIEEVLFPYFGALIKFVKECEPLIEQNHMELLRRYNDKVPNIVRAFGTDWKRSIDQIHQEVMQSFTNFKNGTNILQTALTQLIQYYHRLHKVLSHSAFANCSAKNELVNVHHIMVELKKYKPVF